MENPSAPLTEKRDRLLAVMRELGSCAVALSGGVDSAVAAMAARLALGDRAMAVTGASASLASGELDDARRVAAHVGIRHEVIATEEFSSPDYRRNAPDRCFHCKDELYTRCESLLDDWGVAVIVNGANADDRGDWRPGMRAAADHRVRSPLLECGLSKADVRALAAHWNLPVSDKPASPCLSSRVAYGQEVTPERLAMIDAAEHFLRGQGLRELRVRYHGDDLARIEVPAGEISRLASPDVAERVAAELKRLGFRYVTLDLEGFRSGNLNAAFVPLAELQSSR